METSTSEQENVQKPLVTGVVGLAAGVNLQCYQFKRLPELYSMKWLCDLDNGKVESAVQEYGGKGTTSFNDIIEDPKVELITIATPTSAHFPLAIDALRAGKHVLLEKPVGSSVEEADRLIECAKEAKGKLCIDHERRYYANQKVVEKIIGDGDLGQIVSVRLELPTRKTKEKADPDTWNDRFLRSQIYDYMVHHIDQILILLAEKPQRIFSRTCYLDGDDIPCEMEISLIMPSGVLASVDLRHSHAPDCKWMVNGEEGSVRMKFHNDMSNCYIYQSGPGGARNVRELFPIKTSQEAYLDFYRDLYSSITQNTPVPVSVEDARDAIKAIWLAVESARTGKIMEW